MNPAKTTLQVLQKNGLSVNEYFSKRLLQTLSTRLDTSLYSSAGNTSGTICTPNQPFF